MGNREILKNTVEEDAPLEEMDIKRIEQELAKRKIDEPPRWAFYGIEEARDVLKKVREGEIKPGHKWPRSTF